MFPVGKRLSLDGEAYEVAPNPVSGALPHVIRGHRSYVYRLIRCTHEAASDDVLWALKCWQNGELSANDAPLDGERAMDPYRVVKQARGHPSVTGARLYPWVPGPLWFDYTIAGVPLTQSESAQLARSLVGVLVKIEQEGTVHGNLAGQHVVVRWQADDTAAPSVSLIAWESATPADQRLHESDRHSGGLLLMEMLGWCDSGVRAAMSAEGFTANPGDATGSAARRWLTLLEALQRNWGQRIAALGGQVMSSTGAEGCPTFGEWEAALRESAPHVAPSPDGRQYSDKVGTIGGLPPGITTASVTHRADLLYAGMVDGSVWSVPLSPSSGGTVRRTQCHIRAVGAVAIHPGEPLWASASDRCAFLWDQRDGIPRHAFIHPQAITAMAFWPQQGALVTAALDQRVRIWSVGDGALLATTPTTIGAIRALAVGIEGGWAAVGGHSGAELIPLLRPGLSLRLRGTAGVTTLVSHPTGRWLAVAADDGRLALWPTAGGDPVWRIIAHRAAVTTLSFRADGEQLASGALDGSVHVWTTRGTLVTSMHGHSARVQGIGYQSDGCTLVTAAYDGARRWTVQSALVQQNR